jgi:hypothetical protein
MADKVGIAVFYVLAGTTSAAYLGCIVNFLLTRQWGPAIALASPIAAAALIVSVVALQHRRRRRRFERISRIRSN